MPWSYAQTHKDGPAKFQQRQAYETHPLEFSLIVHVWFASSFLSVRGEKFLVETRSTTIYLLLSIAVNVFKCMRGGGFQSCMRQIRHHMNHPPVFLAQALPTTLSVATPEHPSITIWCFFLRCFSSTRVESRKKTEGRTQWEIMCSVFVCLLAKFLPTMLVLLCFFPQYCG